jgi:ABC-type lipoprotein release transport system permease subunit
MLFKIALRNVSRQRRRTLLTVLTMFGGFTLSSISIAWMDGSYNRIIDTFTRNRLGHIQIHQKDYRDKPSLYRTIDDLGAVGHTLDGVDGVDSWAPRVLAAGLLSVDDKSTGAEIVGIDPVREAATTNFDPKVSAGHPLAREAAHDALLGIGLATRLGAAVGDSVVVLSQAADGSMANDIFRIAGLVDAGDSAVNQTTLYMHIADAQELFVLPERAHEVVIVAHKPKHLSALAATIAGALDRPQLVVEPWQEFARSFHDAMKADQAGNWVTLFIIVLVVAVGVLNTVLMSVLERTREYGLLRAMGTAPRLVFSLVVTEVVVMSIMAVVSGTVVALGINYWMSIHGMAMPTALEFAGVEFKHMYAEINARSYVIPTVTVIAAALIVAVFPALKAARTRPATAMRTH